MSDKSDNAKPLLALPLQAGTGKRSRVSEQSAPTIDRPRLQQTIIPNKSTIAWLRKIGAEKSTPEELMEQIKSKFENPLIELDRAFVNYVEALHDSPQFETASRDVIAAVIAVDELVRESGKKPILLKGVSQTPDPALLAMVIADERALVYPWIYATALSYMDYIKKTHVYVKEMAGELMDDRSLVYMQYMAKTAAEFFLEIGDFAADFTRFAKQNIITQRKRNPDVEPSKLMASGGGWHPRQSLHEKQLIEQQFVKLRKEDSVYKVPLFCFSDSMNKLLDRYMEDKLTTSHHELKQLIYI